MKIPSASGLLFFAAVSTALVGAPDPNWLGHDRARPMATPITPGTFSSQDQPGQPPSDATVLFDGKDTSAWVAMDGSPTKWVVRDGALECVPGSGYVRSLQAFGDCQLHVEWAAPTPAHGESQGRGNSGVFFGLGRYEIQVLDSYQSKTYADGAAAAIYGQYPPLVNAALPPGQWQVYDAVWTAPRFDADGKLASKARLTVFHNGVLVQNNVELTGPTGWVGRVPYPTHPLRSPIAFQDHGNPVRYRNVWVRELGQPRHKEITIPDATAASYVGDYGSAKTQQVKVTRLTDNLLELHFASVDSVLHAESPTHFYTTETTDVQCDFIDGGKKLSITVGEDQEHPMTLDRASP